MISKPSSDSQALEFVSLCYSAELATGGTAGKTDRFANPRLWLEHRSTGSLRPEQLRIRLLRVGICGTDLHLLETHSNGFIRCSSPLAIPNHGRVIGHEGVGIVEEVGSGVTSVCVGDTVCCESILTCGVCFPCRRGDFNQCDSALLLGLQSDGLFSEQAILPSRIVHRVNDLVESPSGLDGLACIEPAAVAFLACQNARITPGQSILVIGGGPIGYLCALLAKDIFGAGRVVLSEPNEFRREHASAVADVTLHPDRLEDFVESFDVVIEAAGALEAIDRRVNSMRPNGRIVLLARTGVPLTIQSVDVMITRSISLIGSRGHLGGAFDAVLTLMRTGRLDLKKVVTQVVIGMNELMAVLCDPLLATSSQCKIVADLSKETSR